MKLFGFELRKVPKETPADEALADAVDQLNEAWERATMKGLSIRPWIDWKEREVLLTVSGRGMQEVYNSREGWIE